MPVVLDTIINVKNHTLYKTQNQTTATSHCADTQNAVQVNLHKDWAEQHFCALYQFSLLF